jgi:hypothetical protein
MNTFRDVLNIPRKFLVSFSDLCDEVAELQRYSCFDTSSSMNTKNTKAEDVSRDGGKFNYILVCLNYFLF